MSLKCFTDLVIQGTFETKGSYLSLRILIAEKELLNALGKDGPSETVFCSGYDDFKEICLLPNFLFFIFYLCYRFFLPLSLREAGIRSSPE